MEKPNLNCRRMPEVTDPYWDSVNSLHGLDELCSDYLDKTKTVLELGTYEGVSTKLFAYYAKHVTTVDIIKKSNIDSLLNEYNNINFIEGKTQDILSKLNIKYDLIYIDADHSYNNIKQDILGSINLLNENGIISGHDYDNYTKNDVFVVVNEFFPKIKIYSDQSWVALR
jgi:hypothetical protein